MNRFIRQLKTGELHVGKSAEVLATSGIGSCIVICLWDSDTRIGGMVHAPFASNSDTSFNAFRSPGLSPDTAVPHILNKMGRLGSRRATIVAKLIGAGNMFANMDEGPMFELVQTILRSAEHILDHEGLPVVSSSLGGSLGRSASFDLVSGVVKVTFTDGMVLEI